MSPEIAVWRDVGQDNIRSRGLFVEAGAELDLPDLQAMADLVITAHAPWILPEAEVAGTRLHIASTDEQFRQGSVRVIERYIDWAHKRFGQVNEREGRVGPVRYDGPHVPIQTDHRHGTRAGQRQHQHRGAHGVEHTATQSIIE